MGVSFADCRSFMNMVHALIPAHICPLYRTHLKDSGMIVPFCARIEFSRCSCSLSLQPIIFQVGDDILGLFPILDCFYTFLPIVRGRFDVLEAIGRLISFV